MAWKSQHKWQLLVIAVVCLSIGFALGASTMGKLGAQQQLPESIVTTEQWLAALYQRLTPSVVAITVASDWEEYYTEPPEDESDQVYSTGSGFVIDLEGHIITNYHVVEGANEIIVRFLDNTQVRAEIVGTDPDSDIAVIQVDLPAERLFPVTFGNVEEVFAGQAVVALGSPFGNDWTLTYGIVSAVGRTIPGLGGYGIGAAIQTDAPINPGNSGGPLLNLRGEVIGVNAQIASEVRANSGVGFAIPIDLVQRVAKELIEDGEVAYSVIGITAAAVDLLTIEALNLPNNQNGVVIAEVDEQGPAEAAGLQNAVVDDDGLLVSADIITAINGEPVVLVGDILTYLARYTRPGDVVDLTVLRDGEEIVIPVTLGQR